MRGRCGGGRIRGSSRGRGSSSTICACRAVCTRRCCARRTRTRASSRSTGRRRGGRPGWSGSSWRRIWGRRGRRFPSTRRIPALPVPCRISVLARDRVRFVGEAVAVVVADDPYRAHDALDLIRVEYEALPAVVDVEAAIAAGATVVHDEVGSNVVAEWRQQVGDAAAAIASAPVVVKTRVRLSRGGAHPLEPRGLVARWDGRFAHGVGRRADGASPPGRDRRPARRARGARAGDRAARRGRRLRHQGHVLPRVRRGGRAGAAARPAGEVDRDAAGAHAGRLRGARPGPRRGDRGHARRTAPGAAGRLPARHGRLHDLGAQPAAERDDPLGGAVRDPEPRPALPRR